MTMIATVALAVAALAGPAVLVLAVLVTLGTIVGTLADGLPNGLVRPNPS